MVMSIIYPFTGLKSKEVHTVKKQKVTGMDIFRPETERERKTTTKSLIITLFGCRKTNSETSY